MVWKKSLSKPSDVLELHEVEAQGKVQDSVKVLQSSASSLRHVHSILDVQTSIYAGQVTLSAN